MAQADNRKGFYPVSSAEAKIIKLPVAATQTLTRGDAVILSSGQVAIALSNSAELAGVMAQDAVLLTQGDLVEVYDRAGTVFEGRMDGTTSYVAGGDVDITGATGAMQVDADATSTNVLKLIRRQPGDTDAAGQRWLFTINLNAFADTST